MKRTKEALFLAALAGAALSSPADDAAAANLTVTRATISRAGHLNLNISERAMGEFRVSKYRGSARAEATFVCVDQDGEPLGGALQETLSDVQVQGERSFRSNQNGLLQGLLTLRLDATPALDCPDGSTPALARVQYTSILVSRPGAYTTAAPVQVDFIEVP